MEIVMASMLKSVTIGFSILKSYGIVKYVVFNNKINADKWIHSRCLCV